MTAKNLALATITGTLRTAPVGRTSSRSFGDRLKDVFNVKDYGALGDFSTDDTAAIQLCVNQAGTVGAGGAGIGGTVFFPPGGYNLSSGVGVDISGAGLGSRIIGSGNGATFISGNIPNGFIFHDNGGASSPSEIAHLILSNTSTNIGSGALTIANGSAHIHDCGFRGMINVLLPTNIYDMVIERCGGSPNQVPSPGTGYIGTLGIAGYAPHIIGWRSTTNFQTCFQLWGSNGGALIGNGIENCEVAMLLGMFTGWASHCTVSGDVLTVGGSVGSGELNFGTGMQIFMTGLPMKAWGTDPNDTTTGTTIIAGAGTGGLTGSGGAGTYQLSSGGHSITTPVPAWTRYETAFVGVTVSSFQNEGCHYGLYANAIGAAHIAAAGGNSASNEAIGQYGQIGFTPHSGFYIRKAGTSVFSGCSASAHCHGGGFYFEPGQPVNNTTFISCVGNRNTNNTVTASISGTVLTVTGLSAGDGIGIGLAVTGSGVTSGTVITGSKASEPATKTFTVTVASPGVIWRTAHGLIANDGVQFVQIFGSETLPTGLSFNTTYYVKTVVNADSFTVSATPGGSAINTTGSSATGTLYIVKADGSDGLSGYVNTGTYRVNHLQTSSPTGIDYGPDWVLPTNTTGYTGLELINCGTTTPTNTALTKAMTFTSLPGEAGASTAIPRFEGMEYNVTDGQKSGTGTAAFGDTVVGGGAQHIKVRYNGTNWTRCG